MVKETHNFTHDPTLAFDIYQKINSSTVKNRLIETFPSQTHDLFIQLQKLGDSQKGNQIPSILQLIDEHANSCKQYQDLDESALEVKAFFDDLAQQLKDLEANIAAYHVAISCAVDGYTLNSTSSLIATLQSFIEKEIKEMKQSNSESKETTKTIPEPKLIAQEINVAQDLKCQCEEIRQQIGSSETMPRGLVIFLVMHLCEAVHTCQELAAEFNKELIDCIHKEIEHIRKLYPELAEAGENLQKAITSYHLEKQ